MLQVGRQNWSKSSWGQSFISKTLLPSTRCCRSVAVEETGFVSGFDRPSVLSVCNVIMVAGKRKALIKL